MSKAKTAQIVAQATAERVRAAKESRRERLEQIKRSALRDSIRRNSQEIAKGTLKFKPFANLHEKLWR